MRRSSRILLTTAALTLWSGPSLAQAPAPAPAAPPPPAAAATAPAAAGGLVGAQATATTGATNLDSTKFATIVPTEETTDATELELGAGGLFISGNARSVSLTGNARFRIRRDIHEFSAGFAGNYGRAALADAPSQDTVRNVQGRIRYDVFMHKRVAFFLMATARHDPFLGLKARLRVDPGFAFFIINQAKHRLWAELGYDLQFDARRVLAQKDDCLIEGALVDDGCFVIDLPNTAAPAEGQPDTRPHVADRNLITHSARLFAGYSHQLSEIVSFTTGLEYIQAFVPLRTSDTDPPKAGEKVEPRLKMWVNWDAALSVQIRKNLAFATTFTLRYDNAPLPTVRRLDTITAVNLVYRFF
jgi:putative salt-induced outer membrane protein YdiY